MSEVLAETQTMEQHADMLCDDSLINKVGCHTSDNPNALYPIKVSDEEILLFHPLEFSPFLYRGQNEYIEICKPTILREMSYDEKLIAVLQKHTFIDAIKTHHLINVFKSYNILSRYQTFKPYRLKIDYEAIAQHYEFKTNHLDFSKDKDVAMFFMTCKYDNKLKKFIPITDNSTGILYTYDYGTDIKTNSNAINPIGYQPFSRPDKQKAFSVIFSEDTNLNTFKYVKKKEFTLTKERSEKYFNMFDGGDKLFPDDDISELAYDIQNNKFISIHIIENYAKLHKVSIMKIIKILKNNNLLITTNKYSFTNCGKILADEIEKIVIDNLYHRVSPRGLHGHICLP